MAYGNRRGASIRTAAACACAALVVAAAPACGAKDTGSAATPKRTDVEVIAFQQPWTSIAKECTNTYGPEGVAYVEVSPPQESIQGTQWWTSYQPVSYKLDSKLGTEAEFKDMIDTCAAAGVGIIADVVLNQTTGAAHDGGWKEGVAGSKYDPTTGAYPAFTGGHDQYPQGVDAKDFHDWEHGASISGYMDQQEVQEGRLSGMWDFDTSSDKVRDIQTDYLAKLYDMGVKGFRMDAVKHISAEDMQAVKTQMAEKVGKDPDDIYWIQEVIGNAAEASGIQPRNYLNTGSVTQFAYVSNLNSALRGDVSALADLGERLGDTGRNKFAIASKDANVFVTNWDTARNPGQAITYKDGALYALANAFLLAYDYGTPRLLSDYRFADRDAGAPGATDTSVPAVDFDEACAAAGGDWNCQQRWTPTRGMIAFHNYVHGTKVEDLQEPDSSLLAFSRGDKGFVAFNNGAKEVTHEFATTMPDGEYCDVYAVEDCSKTVKVRKGKVQVTLAPTSAVALYAGATKGTHPAASRAVDPSTPQW
ncbi:alpha-amylase family protein [uncultured Bifidobacterium sp.]|uniref:alpha-amylase n=1 Tax=uncultured Bifidobacterium sp. TaxID=165187 RepID=UPI00338F521F